MAYIRCGVPLPSGVKSGSHAIGDPSALMSFNAGSKRIPYAELVDLLRTKTYPEIIVIVRDRLLLTQEEAEFVCEGLFEEHRKGEWERVPEWAEGEE